MDFSCFGDVCYRVVHPVCYMDWETSPVFMGLIREGHNFNFRVICSINMTPQSKKENRRPQINHWWSPRLLQTYHVSKCATRQNSKEKVTASVLQTKVNTSMIAQCAHRFAALMSADYWDGLPVYLFISTGRSCGTDLEKKKKKYISSCLCTQAVALR